MTSIENQIINLIISQDENDQVDFKKEYYSKEKKYDLIKDIVSFANNIKPRISISFLALKTLLGMS